MGLDVGDGVGLGVGLVFRLGAGLGLGEQWARGGREGDLLVVSAGIGPGVGLSLATVSSGLSGGRQHERIVLE